jgi:hypothetical protein
VTEVIRSLGHALEVLRLCFLARDVITHSDIHSLFRDPLNVVLPDTGTEPPDQESK